MSSGNKGYADISHLWTECSKRDLLSNPPTLTALGQLRIDPYNQNCLKFVYSKINAFDKREMLHPEPFRKTNPQTKDSISGSINLGVVRHTKTQYGLDPHNLNVHLCVVGRNGGGKTTIIKHILISLLEREKI